MNIVYKNKNIIFFIGILFFFTIGYFLRAYYDIHTFLPGSPYEIYSVENQSFSNSLEVSGFNDKTSRYPFSNFINSFIPDSIKGIYWIYLLLSIAVFYVAKKITKSSFGGFLAFSTFVLSGENLIHYTKDINTSGLSYFFIILSLYLIYKYLNDKKNIYLILFLFAFILNTMTYHTGATALAVLAFSILLVSVVKNKFNFQNIKLSITFAIGLAFYLHWLLKNDLHQLSVILNSIGKIFDLKILAAILVGTIFLYLIYRLKNLIKKYFKYLVYLSVIVSFALILFNNFNVNLSFLGIENYYVSSKTLILYLVQIILIHTYIIYFLPDLIKNKDPKNVFLSGWLLGLIIIFIGLFSQGYIARILDYSFFFGFILFAIYWNTDRPFQRIIVPTILSLIVASQFLIFSDSFSLRRYYTEIEFVSAQRVSNLNLEGFVISDLRTSALLSYFGYDNTYFETGDNPLHNAMFYYPELINKSGADYIILSENMKDVLYSRDYPTTPITQDLIEYYDSNYETILNNGIHYIYKLK